MLRRRIEIAPQKRTLASDLFEAILSRPYEKGIEFLSLYITR